MSVGAIILLTALTIWLLMVRRPDGVAQLAATAVPLPTPAPTATPAEEPAALLPETPLEPTYPEHFVSALEAAVPNVGQPTRIVIPTIDVDAPVVPIGMQAFESDGQTYYQWQVPSAYKAGWHNTSARLGHVGNTVLNGHHNIYGEVFRHLVDLEAGDEIVMHDPEITYTYLVDQVLILEEQGQPISVRRENAQWIEATDDERLTLVTCWPYSDNSHRVIVIAYPTSTSN